MLYGVVGMIIMPYLNGIGGTKNDFQFPRFLGNPLSIKGMTSVRPVLKVWKGKLP